MFSGRGFDKSFRRVHRPVGRLPMALGLHSRIRVAWCPWPRLAFFDGTGTGRTFSTNWACFGAIAVGIKPVSSDLHLESMGERSDSDSVPVPRRSNASS